MTNEQIIKLAASFTYSPMAAASRNYTPPKSGIKFGTVRINGSDEIRAKKVKFDKTDTPKAAPNTTTDPDDSMAPFRRFSNDFKNAISGTGYGRRYWTESPARNAYSLS